MEQEQHRHRCLVRQLLAYRVQWGRDRYHAWINGPRAEKIRKQTAADCMDQWKKGNRGQWGDWR